jgi:hypothetical protein
LCAAISYVTVLEALLHGEPIGTRRRQDDLREFSEDELAHLASGTMLPERLVGRDRVGSERRQPSSDGWLQTVI